ncbi:MAG: hypothetical protein KDA89_23055 [Planctomycetaceae bacterium]|nr:hypothetical protein [Planctomycetaceae bacterium]
MVLQARLYQDEEGHLYFGDRLGAAFCSAASPGITRKPEPMIAQAVADFRTLGICAPVVPKSKLSSAEAQPEQTPRTLLMAFRYSAGGSAVLRASGSDAVNEFELLFIHLLDERQPNLVVFATSHGRTKFHLLEKSDPKLLTTVPSIRASVRFDDFKLMGLYPSQPVVTDIDHSSRLTIPVESLRKKMLGLGEGEKPMSLDEVLDDIYADAEAAGPGTEDSKEMLSDGRPLSARAPTAKQE